MQNPTYLHKCSATFHLAYGLVKYGRCSTSEITSQQSKYHRPLSMYTAMGGGGLPLPVLGIPLRIFHLNSSYFSLDQEPLASCIQMACPLVSPSAQRHPKPGRKEE